MENIFDRLDLVTEEEREYEANKKAFAAAQKAELQEHQDHLDEVYCNDSEEPTHVDSPAPTDAGTSTKEEQEEPGIINKPKLYGGLLIDTHIINEPADKLDAPRYGWKYVAYDNPKEWLIHLYRGHIFCNGKYKKEDDPKQKLFGKYRHTRNLWQETYMVCIDGDQFRGIDFNEKGIDENPNAPAVFTELDDIDQFEGIKHCYAITESVSSMTKGKEHRRFRLVFVLEKPFKSHAEIKRFIDWVHSEIPFACNDHRHAGQPVYGNKDAKPVRYIKNIIPGAIIDKIRAEVKEEEEAKAAKKAEQQAKLSNGKQERAKNGNNQAKKPVVDTQWALDMACQDEPFVKGFMARYSGQYVGSDGDGYERYHHRSGQDGDNNPSDWYQKGSTDGTYIVGAFSPNSEYHDQLDDELFRPLPYVLKGIYKNDYGHLSDYERHWKIEEDIIKEYPYLDHGRRPKKYQAGQGSYPIEVLCQSLQGVNKFLNDKLLEDSAFVEDTEWSPNVIIKRKDGTNVAFRDYFCQIYFGSKWEKVFGDGKTPKTKVQMERLDKINGYARPYISGDK